MTAVNRYCAVADMKWRGLSLAVARQIGPTAEICRRWPTADYIAVPVMLLLWLTSIGCAYIRGLLDDEGHASIVTVILVKRPVIGNRREKKSLRHSAV